MQRVGKLMTNHSGVLYFASIIAVASFAGCRSTPFQRTGRSEERATKAIVRRWFDDVINQRNLDVIDEIFSPDYVYHGADGAELRGQEAVRSFAAAILTASDDRHAVVEQQVAEGNLVATRFRSSGHHTGVFQGIQPTGKIWTTEGIDISRIENGKIVEDWEIVHQSGL
jgi:predicted ester cyclase